MKVEVTMLKEVKQIVDIPDTCAGIDWKAEFMNPTKEGNPIAEY